MFVVVGTYIFIYILSVFVVVWDWTLFTVWTWCLATRVMRWHVFAFFAVLSSEWWSQRNCLLVVFGELFRDAHRFMVLLGGDQSGSGQRRPLSGFWRDHDQRLKARCTVDKSLWWSIPSFLLHSFHSFLPFLLLLLIPSSRYLFFNTC